MRPSSHATSQPVTEPMQQNPRPKKSLGQNFLKDQGISRKIVRTLGIGAEDCVIEIGPGPGALTEHMVEVNPARLILVEKDDHWAAERAASLGAELFPGAFPLPEARRAVVCADALRLPWESLDFPCKLIGNLPYNVASPLMWEIFSRASGLTRAVFMIQKEVGLRICAEPGTSAYGALTVWVKSFMRPKMEFIVPPHVFYPAPKVDSAVLSFEPLPAWPAPFSPSKLAAVLHKTFSMRRKQLGTIFQGTPNRLELLTNLGIDPKLRPENLTPQEFHLLAGAGFLPGRD